MEKLGFPPGREKLFLMLVHDHYNRHPLLEVGTSIEILERNAVVELIGFLNQPGDANLLSYMTQNWYCPDSFKLWGRMNPTFIALTKTTMYVEGHWSMFKRGFCRITTDLASIL